MITRLFSATLRGIDAQEVEVEVNARGADKPTVTLAQYNLGSVDVIKYTDKFSGQPTVFKQIKLCVIVQDGPSKKSIDAIMRVKDGENPGKILAAMKLKKGRRVILDVDTLAKHAPAKNGAASSWTLRVHGAYNLEDEDKNP